MKQCVQPALCCLQSPQGAAGGMGAGEVGCTNGGGGAGVVGGGGGDGGSKGGVGRGDGGTRASGGVEVGGAVVKQNGWGERLGGAIQPCPSSGWER